MVSFKLAYRLTNLGYLDEGEVSLVKVAHGGDKADPPALLSKGLRPRLHFRYVVDNFHRPLSLSRGF